MKHPLMTADWRRMMGALLTALCLATVAEPSAAGGNLGFLKDAPIAHFQGADRRLFETNTFAALDNDADGATRSWENPDTGSSGNITPLKTFEKDGRRCRNARIVNQTRSTGAATNYFTFCRQADDRWVAAPAKPAQ